MAALTVTQIADTGTTQTLAAVSASDTFVNDGKTFLVVANASGGAVAVGIATPATVDGKSVGDGGGSVANGATKMFGPFRPDLYNSASGTVTVTYDVTTSVTAAVFKLP